MLREAPARRWRIKDWKGRWQWLHIGRREVAGIRRQSSRNRGGCIAFVPIRQVGDQQASTGSCQPFSLRKNKRVQKRVFIG